MNNKSIFHYTRKFETICEIIENGFVPSFCKEQLCTSEHCYDFAVPMVSFCDIPLSRAEEHKNKYGKFAIGVKKEWCKKNNINPIYYLNNETGISNSLVGVLTTHSKYIKTCSSKIKKDEIYNHIRTISHFKNYSGKIEGISKKITFYNEKEWRYVPIFTDDCGKNCCKLYLKNKFGQIKIDYPKKPHLLECALKTELSNITHIVVPTKKSKYELINCLSKNKKLTKNENQFYDLLTKILTYQEIVYDI
jgi:Putative abortive phage resistance protein AbiGi, antitoxin